MQRWQTRAHRHFLITTTVLRSSWRSLSSLFFSYYMSTRFSFSDQLLEIFRSIIEFLCARIGKNHVMDAKAPPYGSENKGRGWSSPVLFASVSIRRDQHDFAGLLHLFASTCNIWALRNVFLLCFKLLCVCLIFVLFRSGRFVNDAQYIHLYTFIKQKFAQHAATEIMRLTVALEGHLAHGTATYSSMHMSWCLWLFSQLESCYNNLYFMPSCWCFRRWNGGPIYSLPVLSEH